MHDSSLKPQVLQKLTAYLALLPGIGMKTANRLAFFIATEFPQQELKNFSALLASLKNNLKYCSFCNVLTDTNPCSICASQSRNNSKLLLVASSLDVYKIEETKIYDGLYYVLSLPNLKEVWDDNVNSEFLPKDLKNHFIKRVCNLIKMLKGRKLEVIFGLPVELKNQGIYFTIKELLINKCSNKVVLSKLAVGLSIGADIEFADPQTLALAINNRQIDE